MRDSFNLRIESAFFVGKFSLAIGFLEPWNDSQYDWEEPADEQGHLVDLVEVILNQYAASYMG